MKLRVGGVPEHFNLPWRLAIEEGKFKAADIELHWSDMTGGTGQMIKGLQAGSLDIAVLLTEGITRAILKGLDAKIIAVYVVCCMNCCTSCRYCARPATSMRDPVPSSRRSTVDARPQSRAKPVAAKGRAARAVRSAVEVQRVSHTHVGAGCSAIAL